MFQKVLVANRGEIAVRVIRALKELGVTTVAIYSEADEGALHTQLADEAVLVGPASAGKSYLNIPNIMQVVGESGVDAVHPGYGFLSENAAFAEVCKIWGVTFIGPSPEAISSMGVKSVARETMAKAGVPVAPGGRIGGSMEETMRLADEVGYPVMVKASAGGGGRGIRIVRQREELESALERAASEAKAAFGDGTLYMEKYLEDPRHIEIQVLADQHGGILTLGERESSIQRRRQKLIEEAPSVALDEPLRERFSEAAARAAEAVSYANAGTVEFLLDDRGAFYFMEMNTRIQVEHGVTELVTGFDIVKEQIRIAAGEPLSVTGRLPLNGWAIECRINAEDPEQEFRPSPGVITAYRPPGGFGVRVDSGVDVGTSISPFYDSMIAKVMTWGTDRPEALARMRRALGEFHIEGIKTTLPLHLNLLDDPEFVAGRIHTNFLERRIGQ